MQKIAILSKINAIYAFIFKDAKILFNDVFAICLKSELRDYGLFTRLLHKWLIFLGSRVLVINLYEPHAFYSFKSSADFSI
jgi:hypothetical protein